MGELGPLILDQGTDLIGHLRMLVGKGLDISRNGITWSQDPHLHNKLTCLDETSQVNRYEYFHFYSKIGPNLMFILLAFVWNQTRSASFITDQEICLQPTKFIFNHHLPKQFLHRLRTTQPRPRWWAFQLEGSKPPQSLMVWSHHTLARTPTFGPWSWGR